MTELSSAFGDRAGQVRRPIVHLIGQLLAGLVLSLLFMVGQVAADDTSSFKTVAGIGVYIGLMPSAIVRGHQSGHTEAQMHGGPPSGSHA